MSEQIRRARGLAAHRRGRWAELMCLARLWLTGWRVLAHRLAARRGSGLGEIDIVARRGRVLAFIEVKARPGTQTALEAIGPGQRARLQSAAAAFLARHPAYNDCDIRFDAMVVADRLWPSHVADAWRPS